MNSKKNSEKQAIIAKIKTAKNVLIIGHIRPDGDCLGAGLALKRLVENTFKNKADFLCDGDKPPHYAFMKGFDTLNEKTLSSYDLLIMVDCADIMRMGRYSGYLKTLPGINIDHHVTNNKFGSDNFVFPDASSTCELVYEILKDFGYIDEGIAECLFVGLSTDTGHFMHRNTTEKTFLVAADLIKYNIDVNSLANKLYRSNTMQKTRLIQLALKSMRFFSGDEICVISLTQNDLDECGCTIVDTEGIIDLGMNISSVNVAVLVTEQKADLFKVSFRSKTVDVASAAAVFGGGGHKLAAGCQISGKKEDIIRKAVKSVTDGMN